MEIFGIANKETVLGVNLFEIRIFLLHIIEALRRKEAITFRIKYLSLQSKIIIHRRKTVFLKYTQLQQNSTTLREIWSITC